MYVAPATTAYAAPVAMPLGMDGYSTVTLLEQGRWQVGDRRFGALHRGRTYLFTSAEELQRFLANPDAYSPVASGQDVVAALNYGQEVEGKRSLGLTYQNRIYLFSSQETQQMFVQNRDRYATEVLQAENLTRPSWR
jgi:protein disulfide-isomerase